MEEVPQNGKESSHSAHANRMNEIQISDFIKSVQWKPRCSMLTDGRTDRQTDMMKLIVAFCNFANMPKIPG